MKFSIIVTHYKTEKLTDELLKTLVPQKTDDVQILVIDASNNMDFDKYSKDVEIYHIEDINVSHSRNVGIDLVKGKYLTFIDGDDMVAPDYVEKILKKINETKFDRCFFSWRFRNLKENVIIKDYPPEWNWVVWNCVYRKEWLGDTRFDESLAIVEDVPFLKELKKKPCRKENIEDILYIYYDSRDGSNTQKMHNRLRLSNAFYFQDISEIGGVETFFWEIAKKYYDYDITVYYRTGNTNQTRRLKKYVRVKKYVGELVECEKVFFNYYFADVIDNFKAKEKYQIIHTDYSLGMYKPIIDNRLTGYIAVSEAAAKSFEDITGIKPKVIYNPITVDKPKKCLLLISATRLSDEKGKDKIIEIGNQLNEYGYPYLWLIFTTDTNAINNPNIVYMKPKLNIRDYLAKADFVLQLSKKEAYCYTLVEALSLGVPVIATEMPVLEEIGLNESNSIILKQDLSNLNVKDFYTKEFNFTYTPPESEWDKELIKSKSNYKEELEMRFIVEANENWGEHNLTRVEDGKTPKAGDQWEVGKERLDILLGDNQYKKAFVKVIEEVKEENPILDSHDLIDEHKETTTKEKSTKKATRKLQPKKK